MQKVKVLRYYNQIERQDKCKNKEQNKEFRAVQRKIGKWCGVIMMVAVILFLLSIGIEIGGFQEDLASGLGYQWKTSIMAYSWIVFPIGGIICGIVAVIFNSSLAEKEDTE